MKGRVRLTVRGAMVVSAIVLAATPFSACGGKAASGPVDAARDADTESAMGMDSTAADDASTAAVDAVADRFDGAEDGGTQTPACLMNAYREYRITLDGVGFEAYEGMPVVGYTAIRLISAQATCRATAATRVQGGRFSIPLINLSDGAAYPDVGAFIDLGDDGSCTAAMDPSWHVIDNVNDKTWNLTPAHFSVPVSGCITPGA